MAQQINKYTTLTAYNADTGRDKNKSAVSEIAAEGTIIYDGVNVVAPKTASEIGDLVVFDTIDQQIKVAKSATVNKSKMPVNLTPVGVVYNVYGDKVSFVSLDTVASKRWAAPYEVALSDFKHVAGGSFTLNIGGVDFPVTYPAGATLDSITAQINALGISAVADGGWIATTNEAMNAIIMTSNTNSLAKTNITATGCTIIYTESNTHYQVVLAGLINGTVEYVRRNNHINASFAGCNRTKFLQYYSASGTTPTANVPVGSSTIVNQASFEGSEFCTALRAKYTTYAEYLYDEHQLQYPAAYGAVLRDGKANTQKIGTQMFTDIRGASAPCYPAAYEALNYSLGVEGFAAGEWWLPSVDEGYQLMEKRALDANTVNDDPVNRTLVRMSKATCYGTYTHWLSCEYVSNSAFIYGGSNGSVSNSNKYRTCSVRPVSAFQM